ncbi:unnamed protein product [Protopolystoma xenopodis]|uniref:Uncharacterized protein n=1 Tax=Protopolystoma xenopodis TaxID=117903 RepID=A0A3S5ASP6_9PLAT|nr:unnamed protein product [Protopolystoma xenopodis]
MKECLANYADLSVNPLEKTARVWSLRRNIFDRHARVLYGINVEEYLNWMVESATISSSCSNNSDVINSGVTDDAKLLGPKRTTIVSSLLSCPLHPFVKFLAPDLNFEDVMPELMASPDRIYLERFLNRGTFGSVFAGKFTSSVKSASCGIELVISY